MLQYGGNWAGAYLLRRSVYMPWELDEVLDPALVEEGLRRLAPLSRIAAALQTGQPLGDFDRVAALETSLYMRNQLLRDADWAGMSHGVEIRVPFVDPFFLAALPPGAVLAGMNAKDAIAEVPDPPLPDSVRHRRKTGFSTPVGRWLREASRRSAAAGHRSLRGLAGLGAQCLARRLDRPGVGLSDEMGSRILALVGDCYGARGGIARYNQDLFDALADGKVEILILPRHGDASGLALPPGVRQNPPIFGRLSFSLAAIAAAWRFRPVDTVFCGHVFMAPLGFLLARLLGARYWVQAHGTDIWKDRRGLVRRLIGRPIW